MVRRVISRTLDLVIYPFMAIGLMVVISHAQVENPWRNAMVRPPLANPKPDAVEPDKPNNGPFREPSPAPKSHAPFRGVLYTGTDAYGRMAYSHDPARLSTVAASLPFTIYFDGEKPRVVAEP